MAAPGRFALKQDIVEVVVGRLDTDTRKIITNDIIVKTQEELRLMDVKARQKLSALDTPETRAAILLDYVARELKGTRLDHKKLLRALGINEKNKAKFTSVYDIIGNYRTPEPNIPPKGVQARSRQSSYPLRQSVASQTPTENSIPRLAIRLSSLILDPNGFASKAKALFDDIHNFVRTMEMPRRSDQLRDIQRFWTYYEAACLYAVVAKAQTKKLSRMAKPNKQKQDGTTAGKEVEETNHSLEIDDILNACPNFSERDFHQVCKHVLGLVTRMEEEQGKAAKKKSAEVEKASQKTNHKNRKSKKRGRSASITEEKTNGNPTENRKGNQESEAANAEKVRSKKTGNGEEARIKASFDISIPSLYEWQDQVLKEACEGAQKELLETGISADEMDESKLLAHAADAVLRQYGLLP